jgi:HlyD family secretion protein
MITRFRRLSLRSKALVVAMVLLATSGAVWGAAHYGKRAPAISTFAVKRGEFIDSTQLHGEVKALKSASIAAPADVGDLQILKVIADGTQVKPGDVVAEFDKTKTEQDLAQYRSTLKSAEAEIAQVEAQARLTEEEDQTAVLKARYEVEGDRLDASKEEIVSEIEGKEARLKLADAEQKLHEAEEKLRSDKALDAASVAEKTQASGKARFDAQRAERALTEMKLTAPAAGSISLVNHWDFRGTGPYKPGDQVWPGAEIAELPDVSSMQISARVDETERGRLAPDQPVTIQLNAIPDRQFTGRVRLISTIASLDFSGGWPFPRNFNIEIAFDQTDPRLKPGMAGQITVIVEKVLNALVIPVQAMFQKSGRNVTYVWTGSGFEERAVEAGRRSGDQILITQGLNAGDQIALKDPATSSKE